jgi:hypothetical protein
VVYGYAGLAQQPFENIPEWPRLFFSNLNLITDRVDRDAGEQPHHIKYASNLRIADYYRSKIEPDIERTIYSWSLNNDLEVPLKIFNSELIVGAHYLIYEKRIDYDFNADESFRLDTEGKTYSLSVNTQSRANHLDAGISLGKQNIGSTSYVPWSANVGFTLGNYFRILCSKHINYFNWTYRIQFTQPSILLSVPEKIDLNQVIFSSRFFNRLEFKAMVRVNLLNKRHNFARDKTTLLPRGNQYYRRLVLVLNTESTQNWSFAYRNWQSDTDGYFYEQKQVFGKFTKRDEFSEAFTLEFMRFWPHQHSVINLEWGKGEMGARGYVESWPFTPTWIDLMGLRYNLDSGLSYRFVRFGGCYAYTARTWQADFYLSIERILPTGKAKTWEPEIIGIGITNLTVYKLSDKTRDGIYLGIQLNKMFGSGLQISYRFNQYIPVDFSGKSQGGGKKVGISPIKKQYGGGRHVLDFILYL